MIHHKTNFLHRFLQHLDNENISSARIVIINDYDCDYFRGT